MDNQKSREKLNRRQFLNRSALGAAMAGMAGVPLSSALAAPEQTTVTKTADAVTQPSQIYVPKEDGTGQKRPWVKRGELPCGALGKLRVSRIISGGNIISGWCHARDLSFVRNLAQAYLTRAKQFDTLQSMEEVGINTIVLDQIQMEILTQYKKERDGRMQSIVAVRPDWGNFGANSWNAFKTEIVKAIDQGPHALFVHGGYSDTLVKSGKPAAMDMFHKALQFIREQGLVAGIGAHALEVPIACDKQGIEPDFFFKTFHHDQYWSATPKDRRKRFCVDGPKSLDHNEFHDNIFCIDPEDTIQFMSRKKQPWIAFKVLAAGAIAPESGFKYAFENGADFLAVGMFDWEIDENVKIAREILNDVKRTRLWCS
jgi:hypothetical protein